MTAPPLEPRFTVTSRKFGTDACAIDDEDGHLDCEFDGRPSTGSIALWHWELTVLHQTYVQETNTGNVSLGPTCFQLGGGNLSGDPGFVDLEVSLFVVDRDGNRSDGRALERIIKLYPQKNCGYQ